MLIINTITKASSELYNNFLMLVADDPYWNFELEKFIDEKKERIAKTIEEKNSGMKEKALADLSIAWDKRSLNALQQRRSTDDDKLTIKFRLNKEENWARFLIYHSDYNDHIDLYSFEYSYEQRGAIIDNVTKRAILNSDKLWEAFYYETDYNSFMKFIESPLKKLK